jgi:hypothetical protein
VNGKIKFPSNEAYPWWLPFGIGIVLLVVIIVMLIQMNPFNGEKNSEPGDVVERIAKTERVAIYKEYFHNYNLLLDKATSETIPMRKNEQDTAKYDSLKTVVYLLADSMNVSMIDSLESKYGLTDDEMRLIIAEGNREHWGKIAAPNIEKNQPLK